MTRTAIPILLYHAVAERPPAGQASYTVTPAAFREHVHAIAAAGRSALTVAELGAALRGERALPERPVLVTFDDGFADVRPAIEALLGAGLAATAYVTSGWVGRERMLSATAVRELAQLGARVELGAHSVTHPRLDELPPARAAAEIADSKSALEQLAQAPVASFAYPHGSYDRRVRAATVAAGFSAAAAVKNALSHPGDDPFALARVTVMHDTRTERIERLLAGTGAPLAWRRERLRTCGYRSVRRWRRRLGRAVA
jgi:peptidoglycan/xylan/chitin deacetylase (PgdA/CDA1 family)